MFGIIIYGLIIIILTRSVMLQFEILISERLPVDGDGAGAVTGGDVAPLTHEPGDNPVENGAYIYNDNVCLYMTMCDFI